jgi:hypothetical protein
MSNQIGKSIRIFLTDGNVSGLQIAEIGQWTGKAVVFQRAKLAQLAKRDEARKTGVYVLMGPDPDRIGTDRVYIGEADTLYDRLRSHDSGPNAKDFWTRGCLFSSADENLNKAHARYLESRLIQMAAEGRRVILENATRPDPPRISEVERSDMEQFLLQARVLLPVLGFTFAQPAPARVQVDRQDDDDMPVFEWSAAGASARGQEIGDEFVVSKGSTARVQGVDSWTSYKVLRDQLVEDGLLVRHEEDPNLYVFSDDVPFKSPSGAAAVVAGRNTNGRRAWKNRETGETYEDWKNRQTDAADG